MKNKTYRYSVEDSTIGLASFVGLQYLVIALLSAFIAFGLKYTSITGYIASIIIELSFVLAVYFVTRLRKADFVSSTDLSKKLEPKQFAITALIAVISLFGFMAITNTVLGTMTKLGYEYVTSDIVVDTFGKYLLFTLTICIIPAVCEEILFRGLIFNGLSKWSKKGAIILSAALFMLMHGSPDQTIHQFILGIVLALLMLYTGSLWAPILMHFLNNFIALSVSFFMTAGAGESAEAGSLTWKEIGTYAISAVWTSVIAFFLLWWLFGVLKRIKEQKVEKKEGQPILVSIDGKETEAVMSMPAENHREKHFSKLAITLLTISIVLLASDWILALLKGFGINV